MGVPPFPQSVVYKLYVITDNCSASTVAADYFRWASHIERAHRTDISLVALSPKAA